MIFVSDESTSKLPITREPSCLTISFAKEKMSLTVNSLTVNSLDVIEFILGTKNFEILYDGLPMAERMRLKGGHLHTMFLCTLQRPYKTPGLEPTTVIFLYCSTPRAPDDFKNFKYLLIHFSWFTVKFSKPFSK